MVVADASAVADALVRGPGYRELRAVLRHQDVHAPDPLYAEVLSALRRMWAAGDLPAERVDAALLELVQLPIEAHASASLLRRAWSLRDNVWVKDGIYVALAEQLQSRLLTTDVRLAKAVRRHTGVELVQL